MAIPLLGILALGGAIFGGVKIADSYETMTRAKEINRKAKRIANAATKKRDKIRESTNNTLAELGETKIFIMAGSILRFAENFSRIKNVRLNDSVGLEELSDFNPDSQDFLSMKNDGFKAAELIQGGVGSLAAGTATAAGVYGAVGVFGAASTGTAISALSGAAATNATLAWLGGGALAAGGGGMALGTLVLGGLVAAPALIVTGLFMDSKADEALSKAEEQLDEACKYEQDVNNLCSVMEAIEARAAQIKILLEDLDDKFSPAVNKMVNLIDNRGNDWTHYSQDEKLFIGAIVQFAKTIKIIIDTSLLTESGKLRDDETSQMLSSGRALLKK